MAPLTLGLGRRDPLGGQGRRRHVAVYGSPPFNFTSPAIAAGASWYVELANNSDYDTQIAKYLPLDTAELLNNSAAPLALYLDAGPRIPVLAFSTRRVSGIGFWRLRVHNESGVTAVAAGEVQLTVQRSGEDADKAALRAAGGRL